MCFRVYLEVCVVENPTCFSRWSVRVETANTIWQKETTTQLKVHEHEPRIEKLFTYKGDKNKQRSSN